MEEEMEKLKKQIAFLERKLAEKEQEKVYAEERHRFQISRLEKQYFRRGFFVLWILPAIVLNAIEHTRIAEGWLIAGVILCVIYLLGLWFESKSGGYSR